MDFFSTTVTYLALWPPLERTQLLSAAMDQGESQVPRLEVLPPTQSPIARLQKSYE